jgi:hypothetical protein
MVFTLLYQPTLCVFFPLFIDDMHIVGFILEMVLALLQS